jgi:catechol 2,3-dioxygenase-like lactoylglutathione lyase family enzyme
VSTSVVQVNRYDHITIISADLAATRRFYVDLLGMDEVDRPAFGFPGLWFQIGTMQIHVTQEGEESGQAGWGDRSVKITSRGHHFAFEVNNVEEAIEALSAEDVEIASPLQTRPDGIKQVYFYDPDRHLVELFSE